MTMRRHSLWSSARAGAALALIAGGMLGAAQPAYAITLDQARAQGQVCEQPDGYLRALDSSAEVQNFVKRINSERTIAYAEVAAQSGLPAEAAAQTAFQKKLSQFACQ